VTILKHIPGGSFEEELEAFEEVLFSDPAFIQACRSLYDWATATSSKTDRELERDLRSSEVLTGVLRGY
jgi:hypothetical protein